MSSSVARTANLFGETNDLVFFPIWIGEFGEDGSDRLDIKMFGEVVLFILE